MRAMEVQSSVVYVYKNKKTGEYVDENFDQTRDIFEATGYNDYDYAVKALDDFDEPEDWYVVSKLTTVTVIDEKIKV